jgi:pre-mRNA-splicing helicase BRR2
VYEAMLHIISEYLGDQSHEVLIDVANEILVLLKMDEIKIEDKKKEIDGIFKITETTFSKLLNLSKEIKDFSFGIKRQTEFDEKPTIVAIDMDAEENAQNVPDDKLEVQEEEDEDYSEEEAEQPEENQKLLKDEIEEEAEVDLEDIDGFWLSKKLENIFPDPVELRKKEEYVLQALGQKSDFECQNKLVELFDQSQFDFVRVLHENRFKIYYMVRFTRVSTEDEKRALLEEMRNDNNGQAVYNYLKNIENQEVGTKDVLSLNLMKEAKTLRKLALENRKEKENLKNLKENDEYAKLTKTVLNLQELEFELGTGFMSNAECKLPKGSFKQSFAGYEEVFIPPASQQKKNVELKKIEDIPEWAKPAFAGIKSLNVIQSVVYECALKSADNMLICAPTGAGKTNIALMSILQQVGTYIDESGTLDKSKFKIVYIAPMKALVSEIVGSFSRRLKGKLISEVDYDIIVREMTGDMQLSRSQIDETNIIVATPEKWDIVTRKAGDKYFLDFVKLLIVDEIHLLHDSRGPVLEGIIARTLRYTEQTGTHIRLVGLSATLPNYKDVSDFLRVDEKKGLFFFDSTYRPIPMEQQYIGITDKKGLKKMLMMKEILYQKVMERAGKQQMLIFVHSRKETAKTAREIRDQAYANDDLSRLMKEDSASKSYLESEAQNCQNTDLKELLPLGIGIHHAGLSREDRTLVEDLYADRRIQILVSTATLAWGVNLPAKTVIIKGTQIYSPEKGKWIELSTQDIFQMMGRAGRPNLDTSGEGIIITGYNELKYYLSLVNTQLPIESQFISQLADQLNAEIVLGTVTNLKEGVEWLAYTYLYIRMMRSPRVYSITEDEIEDDPFLVHRRTNLIHSAALLLDKHNLIKYDRKSGELSATTLGRISSHYYIKHTSIAVYNEHIKPNLGIIDLFRIFSLSAEFKFIPIRDNEKMELEKLLNTVPVPIRGSKDDASSKVNILLQAYISRMKLDGYAINSDMIYVTQSAARIMRGLFEVFLKRGWATVAETCLRICLMIDKRQWSCMSPLRQYTNLQEKILKRIENQEHLTWEHFYNMTVQQVGSIIKYEKMGPAVHKLIHQFPRLELTAYVQPLTRSSIKVELTVRPKFEWEESVHGRVEPFWILVSDVDNEILLYHEFFVLHKDSYLQEKLFDFTVPLLEPLNPQYFVRVVSDKWLQCYTQIPISFKNLILPAKFPPILETMDVHPIGKESFSDSGAKKLLTKLKVSHLNSIQTQVFDTIYNSFDSYLLAAPGNSGKFLAVLLSAAKLFIEDKGKIAKIVLIAPFKDLILRRKKALTILAECFERQMCILTGNTVTDLSSIDKSHIILTTAENWDNLSRRWRSRKVVQEIRMFVFDHIHMLKENSSAYEVICSRLRFMLAETEKKVRLIALSVSIANSSDVADWLGIQPDNVFNFHPKARPILLDTRIQTFDQHEPNIRFYSMTRLMFQDLMKFSKKKPTIIFVSDKKSARLAAAHLNNYAQSHQGLFLNVEKKEYLNLLNESISYMTDLYLQYFLKTGIGFIYEGMNELYIETILQLFRLGIIEVLIMTHSLSWSIEVKSHTVVFLDTKYFHEKRLVDYPLEEMHEMLAKAGRPNVDSGSLCLLYCYSPTKEYLKKFLFEPIPVESHINHFLPEHLNAEIGAKSIETKQDCMDWIAWTFFYRRIQQNPNFYNLIGVTDVQKNEHLSELIENSVEELVQAECIYVEDDFNLSVINGGMIASHYYINITTISIFMKFIKETSKWKHLFEVLASATEFESIGIREGEDSAIKGLFSEIRHKTNKPVFTDIPLKINVLIQQHLERKSLPSDLKHDKEQILPLLLKLIQALVDCIGYNNWLKPAIMTMKISQMVVQALWVGDSTLLQIPHFTQELVEKCKRAKVETVGKLHLT